MPQVGSRHSRSRACCASSRRRSTPRGCRRQRARFSRALEPDPLRLTGSGRFRYDFVHARIDRAFYRLEVGAMTWEAPDFIEVKMDAEINSYQDDFEREQDDRF